MKKTTTTVKAVSKKSTKSEWSSDKLVRWDGKRIYVYGPLAVLFREVAAKRGISPQRALSLSIAEGLKLKTASLRKGAK